MPEPIQATTSEPTAIPPRRTMYIVMTFCDAVPEQNDYNIRGPFTDMRRVRDVCKEEGEWRTLVATIPGTTPPHPPAAQSGEEWRSKCKVFQSGDGWWSVNSPTGAYWATGSQVKPWVLSLAVSNSIGNFKTEAEARAALASAPPPPDWTPAPPASEKASGFCTHVDLPNGVVWSQTGWYLRLRDGHWRWVCDLTEIDTDAVRSVRNAIASEPAPTPKAEPKPAEERVRWFRVKNAPKCVWKFFADGRGFFTDDDGTVSVAASSISQISADATLEEFTPDSPAPKDAESVGEDIVKRMRERHDFGFDRIWGEAADTIEALRSQLAAMTERAEANHPQRKGGA